MQTGPLGIVGAAAATSMAQRQGETDRLQHDTANQARQAAGEQSAEAASGIGKTDHDEGASDRDADGRRVWETGGRRQDHAENASAEPLPPQGKDASGQSGLNLDLSG